MSLTVFWSMPRSSSVLLAGGTVYIGRQRRVSLTVRSGPYLPERYLKGPTTVIITDSEIPGQAYGIMVGFKAFVFKGKKTATKAFHTLEDYSPGYYWIDNVAVVSRSKHGHLRVHSMWAQDESGTACLGFGAITGGLIGLLAGPGGALASAAVGESILGFFGAAEDVAFNDPKLDAFAALWTKTRRRLSWWEKRLWFKHRCCT